MKTLCWLLIPVTLVFLLSHAGACELFANRSISRWEALESVANRIHFDEDVLLRQKEVYGYYLWHHYKTSSRSRRPEILNEMSEKFKEIAYRDYRFDMMGLILFGPEKGRSIISAKFDYGKLELRDDYFHCLDYTDELLMKHCGPTTSNGFRHTASIPNMCLYVEEKARIKDAIILTCGLNNVALSGLDMENSRIEVTPAPIHGSSGYCGRISINGLSRMELHHYAKTYTLMFEPSVTRDEPHNKIQICFHRNPSLGLCECEKDDWRSIENLSRDSLMSPYEQRYVDVKFDSGVYGYVTVTLKEVPYHQLRYASLAFGVGLLFMAGSTPYGSTFPIQALWDFLKQNSADDRVLNWALRVLAIILILDSSFDTPLAIAAVASSLALQYVLSSIMVKLRKFFTRDEWEKNPEGWTTDLVAQWASDPGFREWVIKNQDRIIVLDSD